jgi:galactose mutarotase-like enzyme
MNIKLENDHFEVLICEQGAELISMKDKNNGTEYIWTADPLHWSRHAPILFPIVGKVRDNHYTVDGKSYNLGQHGFARDMDFFVSGKTDHSATFELCSDSSTLNYYPFKFKLCVNYLLENNTLYITYDVYNKDDKTIYFCIGGHPGFNCPLFENESMEDYYFEFEKSETASISLLTKDGLFYSDTKPFLKNQQIMTLSPEVFAHDALIFKHLKSNKISLKNHKNSHKITVDFSGFPFLGLWSKSKRAPFVCIEPWFGHADYNDFSGEFKDKEGIVELSQNNNFKCQYYINIE